MAVYQYILSTSIRVAASVSQLNQYHLVKAPVERLKMTPTFAPKYIGRPAVRVSMLMRSSLLANGIYHHHLAATLRLRTPYAVRTNIIVRAALRVADTHTVGYVLRLVETIRTSAAITVAARLAQPVTSRLALKASARPGWFKAALDRLRATVAVSSRYTARVKAIEAIKLDDATHVILTVAIVASDTLDLDAGIAGLSAIYHQLVDEVVDFSVASRQPDGTVTTWVVNLRTGAVTEYTDYAFESIVQMPDGTYLAAGLDGNLYQLQGNTDNGQPIIADIMGGLLDMGGSRFTSLKAAYLGVRGQGKFYLRLVTNGDVTRTYEVSTRPLTTARVDIGKGLRSRYIQWELISTGQDFDMTGIEFIPLVSGRRI